jgi:predicted acyl esterase
MVQVQSSWFPIIDRNPQKYVANIFEANDSDFVKAEETIYFDGKHPTHVELPVMK